MTRHALKVTLLALMFLFAVDFQAIGTGARVLPGVKTSNSSKKVVAPRSFPLLLPLRFEPNEGQTNRSVRYMAHGAGFELFLTESESVLSVNRGCQSSAFAHVLNTVGPKQLAANKFGRLLLRHYQRRCKSVNVQMAFERAEEARPQGVEELASKSNYFLGTDRSKWRTDIPNYARVRYTGIYPGVNLVFYGNEGHLEFDFVVAPGADPSKIVLKFDPAKYLRVTRDGNLRIGPTSNSVLLRRPLIYQVEGGRTRKVGGGFALFADGRVGFRVGSYNHRKTLIIDPTLTYSTFLSGANGDSEADGIAVDSNGDAYVVGTTFSPDFPTVNAYESSAGSAANGIGFLSKFNPSGTQLLYSTYFGGTGGDYPTGMALDDAGNAYLTGYTFSTDFPVVNGFQTVNNNPSAGNAFVACINASQSGSASLVYSSYLGGGGSPTNPNPWYGDGGLGIAADSSGRAYVTGDTTSDASVAPFPTTASAYQSSLSSPNGNAFLTVVDTTHSGASSLVYSTYLGGDGAGTFGDIGYAVAADRLGNAYLVGQTTSDTAGPFPTTSGAYQSDLSGPSGNAFVAEIATNKSGSASLVYSTYFGGTASGTFGDWANAVALDSTGKVYVAGYAASLDFPATAGVFQAANSTNGKPFVAKFDLAETGTSSLVYSTLVGGSNAAMGQGAVGIAVDGGGDAVIAGQTSASDFPVTPDAYQSSYKSTGGSNAYLAELNPSGSDLVYATYIGGSVYDEAIGVAIDPLSDIYVAGYTESPDFPTTPGAFQESLTGTSGAFVTEISSPNGATIALSAAPSSAAVASGQSAAFTLSVMSQGTFTSPISFGCNNLPAYASCTFSPNSVAGGSNTNVTLTITTGGKKSFVWLPNIRPAGGDVPAIGLVACLLSIALCTGWILSGTCKRRWRLHALFAATFMVMVVAGCGRTKSVSRTPSGTTQVTVLATAQTQTGTAQSSAIVALTVK